LQKGNRINTRLHAPSEPIHGASRQTARLIRRHCFASRSMLSCFSSNHSVLMKGMNPFFFFNRLIFVQREVTRIAIFEVSKVQLHPSLRVTNSLLFRSFRSSVAAVSQGDQFPALLIFRLFLLCSIDRNSRFRCRATSSHLSILVVSCWS
jgi:hypothetical protein